MPPRPTVAAVVLAGGSGVRVGQGRNKAYLPVGGRTVVTTSLRAMATVPRLHRLVLVVRGDDVTLAEQTLAVEFPDPPVPVELVLGGVTRHGSEECALRHLAPAIGAGSVDVVLIHDAARPLCSPELVAALVQAAAEHGGAVPGLPADDLAAFGVDGTVVPLAGRHVRVQTPQAFAARPLLEAYERAAGTGFDGTDTAACVERFSSLQVRFVPGEPQNFKITYPSDVGMADHFLRTAEPGHDTDPMLTERLDDGAERDDPDGPPGRSAAVGAGRGVERNPPGLEPGDRNAER